MFRVYRICFEVRKMYLHLVLFSILNNTYYLKIDSGFTILYYFLYVYLHANIIWSLFDHT